MMAAFHRLHCQEPWFSFLRSGVKPVEGRKNSSKYRSIQAGDRIEFYCGEESFQADVVRIIPFATLADYLQQVGVDKALPGVHSLEEAKRIYLQWSTEEEIAHWGFLGIFIRPLRSIPSPKDSRLPPLSYAALLLAIIIPKWIQKLDLGRVEISIFEHTSA